MRIRFLFLLLLTGCNVESWNIAEAQESCATYGFQPGTEASANCVMKTKQYIEARNMNSQMIISNGLFDNQTPPPRANMTCSPAVGVITPNSNSNPPIYNCR